MSDHSREQAEKELENLLSEIKEVERPPFPVKFEEATYRAIDFFDANNFDVSFEASQRLRKALEVEEGEEAESLINTALSVGDGRLKEGAKDLKVLFVDDEPDILEQAKIFLNKRDNGLSVETASSGNRALEMVENNSCDAIVADYKMPEMDGLELLKSIRERGIDIPFYILTGRGNGKTSQSALELGASGYFRKSPDFNEKFDKLHDILVKSIEKEQNTDKHLIAWITVRKGWGEVKDGKFKRALKELGEIIGFEISEIEKKKVTSEKENIMAYTEHYWDRPRGEPVEAKIWKEIVTEEPEVVDAGFRTRKIQQYKKRSSGSKEEEKVEKKAKEKIENLLQKAESLKKSGQLSSNEENELRESLGKAVKAYESGDHERSLKLGLKTEEYIY